MIQDSSAIMFRNIFSSLFEFVMLLPSILFICHGSALKKLRLFREVFYFHVSHLNKKIPLQDIIPGFKWLLPLFIVL